jgi:leader peptidase (prepilin peptidase)/N-methyltransferase
MTSGWTYVAAATAVAAGLVAAALWRFLLPRLPEPVTDEDKRTYTSLTGRSETARVTLCAAVAGAASALLTPPVALPQCLVLATAGVCLAAVDGFTTWLPARPTRWAWLLMAAALAVSGVVGASWADMLRSLAGAAASGAFYLLAWFITRRGFGFGDVRFVPLIGAATAATGWTTWYAGLLCGSLLALAHALLRIRRHVPGAHPWAPGLLLGSYVALLITT